MKIITALLILLTALTGCKEQSPIVGVWEMQKVIITKMNQMPLVGLTNKKDIYTSDGEYHDTAADSTKKTDTSTSTYTFENGTLKIFRDDGRMKMEGKVVFKEPNLMEIHAKSGEVIIFQKISENPNNIPKVKEVMVQVTFKEEKSNKKVNHD